MMSDGRSGTTPNLAEYQPRLLCRAAEIGMINFEVTYVDGVADGFLAEASGDEWTGIRGWGSSPRKAMLELLDSMEASLAADGCIEDE